MKTLHYFCLSLTCALALLWISACEKTSEVENPPQPSPVSEGTYSAVGSVQKGPFTQGTSITVQSLDEALNPTGRLYQSKTSDDAGSFSIDSQIESRYVEIIAQGYYFNEIEGRVSSSTLTLRSLSDLSEQGKTNVNLLTTLESDRIMSLVGQGQTLAQARMQAEREIFALFNIPNTPSGSGFDKLDITGGSDSDAILLAVSASLQAGRSVGELSELISKIAGEIAVTGEVESASLKAQIMQGCTRVDASQVRENLSKRYTSLGVSDFVIPPFEDYLDINGNGVIDKDDTWLILGQNSFVMPSDGGTFSVELQHNKDYEILCPESWLRLGEVTKAYLLDEVLVFEVDPNDTTDDRYAVIEVKDKESSRSERITLTQKQKDALILSLNSVEIEKEGGTFTVPYAHNAAVSATSNASWVRVVQTKSMENSTAVFEVDASEETLTRTAQVIFRLGSLSDTLSVYQKGGRSIVLSSKEVALPRGAGSFSVQVSSNVSFDILGPDVQWLSLEQGSSAKSVVTHSYTYNYTTNMSGTSRSAVIVFKDRESDLSDALTVTQRYNAEQVVVNVTAPGTLSQYEEQLHSALNLKIAGTLNDDDLAVLAGGTYVGQGSLAGSEPAHFECAWSVEVLDLSEIKTESGEVGTSSDKPFFCAVPTLIEVKMPREVETVGQWSFNKCVALKTIDWGGDSQVRKILGSMSTTGVIGYIKWYYYGAFQDCISLESVTLPASVSTFQAGAFMNCSSLRILSFDSGSALKELSPSKAGYSTGLSTVTNYMGHLWGCTSLETIELPSSLRRIDNYAFMGTPFRRITIPETVRYLPDEYFFEDCDRLEEVRLPSSLTEYHKGMFSGCKRLKSVTGPSKITKYCAGCFEGCSADWIMLDPDAEYEEEVFKGMDVESLTFPKGFKTIPKRMFQLCASLKSVDLAEVEYIDEEAFWGCALTEVVLPKSVRFVAQYAFGSNSSLENVRIDCEKVVFGKSGSDYHDVFYSCNPVITIGSGAKSVTGSFGSSITRIVFETGGTIETFSAARGSAITSIELPSSLTSIPDSAFRYCSALKSIEVPENVKLIGKNAFNNCKSLTSITLHDGLKSIGQGAFFYCSALENVTIPYTVSNIGTGAFRYGHQLEEVHLKSNNPPAIGSRIFDDCQYLDAIYVPDAGVQAYKSAWSDYSSLIVGGEPDGKDRPSAGGEPGGSSGGDSSSEADSLVTVAIPLHANEARYTQDLSVLSEVWWWRDSVTVLVTKNESPNLIRVDDSDHFRLYQKSKLEVSVPSGRRLVSVSFTPTESKYQSILAESSLGACDSDGVQLTIAVAADLGSDGAVVFELGDGTYRSFSLVPSKQARIKEIVVKYK